VRPDKFPSHRQRQQWSSEHRFNFSEKERGADVVGRAVFTGATEILSAPCEKLLQSRVGDWVAQQEEGCASWDENWKHGHGHAMGWMFAHVSP
jgi:hypothetical protein